jgi:HSP20 family protein
MEWRYKGRSPQMSTLVRFRGTAMNPFDFGFSWLPMFGPGIRIEEIVEDDKYVMRAELPGIDPMKDVQLSVVRGELRMQVERKETHAEKGHSEFHYGTLFRAVTLPAGVKADTLTATYADGMLEVTALIGEPDPEAKFIPITVDKATKS